MQYDWYRSKSQPLVFLKKSEITFSDLMALMRRKSCCRKYFNEVKSNEQKLFSQDEVLVLINQLLDAA